MMTWLPTNQRAQNQTAIQTTLPPPAAPPPLAAIFNALRKLDHRSWSWPSTKTMVRPETFIFNQIAPRSPATNSSSIHPDQPQEHNFKINFAFNFIALLFCMGKFQFCKSSTNQVHYYIDIELGQSYELDIWQISLCKSIGRLGWKVCDKFSLKTCSCV